MLKIARDEILRKRSDGTAHLHTFRSIGFKKMRLIGRNAFFNSCFFIHSINQGWAKVFNTRVIFRKPKTPASRKTVCSVNTNTAKNASFTLNDV